MVSPKKHPYILWLGALLLLAGCQSVNFNTDICIYGGNASGVMAAYAADKLGKDAMLVEPTDHLGGLTSGGLGATDIGNKGAITGIARDFYRKLGKHYGTDEMWTFEPHVAESIFNAMTDRPHVKVIRQYRLKEVVKEGTVIREIVLENALHPGKKDIRIKASVFIDCSYEGDLMAKAGVGYTVGREANTQYGETLNGVQLRDLHQFPDSIDPYVVSGKPESGLLPQINPAPLSPNGTGDMLVQTYNYRLCLTQNNENMIPVTPPEQYNPATYELLKRVITWRETHNQRVDLDKYLSIIMMPNGKTDINNNGPVSTDYIGHSWTYAEADYDTRQKIAREHTDYIKGLLYFLGHDPSVPETLRNQMLSWGYAKDEFTENGGFPRQLYVREARRMIGEYVMTEQNCTRTIAVPDSVGKAAYTMDSHNCQRVLVNGMVKNEGDVQVGGFPPYPIAYRSITPRRSACTNLLVPVCLSATHIAYGSIRMEPVFMVLGQSAAMAAAMAIDAKVPVQLIDVAALQQHLKINPLLEK
jgi:hypothetical protein